VKQQYELLPVFVMFLLARLCGSAMIRVATNMSVHSARTTTLQLAFNLTFDLSNSLKLDNRK